MTPFGKDSEMTIHERDPFNAETLEKRLRQSFLTPGDLFFSRNHGSMPGVDPGSYRLSVGGSVDRHLELSLDELYGLPKEELVTVMKCAGNRRVGLTGVAEIPGESRVLDTAATLQPASAEEVWNSRGYANDSWHGGGVVAR